MAIPEKAGELGHKLVANMAQITEARIAQAGLQNARFNLQFLDRGKSLKALRGQLSEKGDHAVVIGAGPSLHRRAVADTLKRERYAGTLIATDSAMSYCLRNGLVPDLVLTLDSHAK